jgi:hypothetical protein
MVLSIEDAAEGGPARVRLAGPKAAAAKNREAAEKLGCRRRNELMVNPVRTAEASGFPANRI